MKNTWACRRSVLALSLQHLRPGDRVFFPGGNIGLGCQHPFHHRPPVRPPADTPTPRLSGCGQAALCAQMRNLMKKFLLPIAVVSLALGACERHPASQLPTEGEGAAKEGPARDAGKTNEAGGFSERDSKNLFSAEFLKPVFSASAGVSRRKGVSQLGSLASPVCEICGLRPILGFLASFCFLTDAYGGGIAILFLELFLISLSVMAGWFRREAFS